MSGTVILTPDYWVVLTCECIENATEYMQDDMDHFYTSSRSQQLWNTVTHLRLLATMQAFKQMTT